MNKNDAAITSLLNDLGHRDKRKIRAAVDALVSLAAESVELRTTLNRLLLNSGTSNSWPVAYVLGQLPHPNAAVIDVLLDALDHPEPDIRWAISLLLVRMAKTNQDLVNRIAERCRTGNPSQKRMALYCLRDLRLGGADSLEPMLNALKDPNPTVRVAAAICLKTRPDVDAAGHGILLCCFLDDPDTRVRSAAAVTLAHLGSSSEEFVTALEKIASDENAQLQKVAARVLAIIKNKRSASIGS